MSDVERTRQQLDPVGTLGSRPLAVSLPALAFYYGLAMTLRTLDQVSNLMLAILALLWLAAASLTVIVATSQSRAPFTRSSHVVVHLLALGAVALSAASQWGENRFIQDDFGPLALGILILALGPYRPATELATAGSLAAVFVGFLTLLEVPALDAPAPPVAFVIVGMSPILALSYASASYSGGLVTSLERWQQSAMESVAKRAIRMREGIARSVRHDRIMILGRDVLPFFSSVIERDTITAEDRVEARRIADSIRALMVAEADRTWLEVVAGDDGVNLDRIGRAVVDVDGRASWMVTDQRTVLRALIVALLDEPAFVERSLRIKLTGTSKVSRAVLTVGIDETDAMVRSIFAPYLAVMRIVFTGLQVDFRYPTLTLKFSYEQR